MLSECKTVYLKCLEGENQFDEIRKTPCTNLSKYFIFCQKAFVKYQPNFQMLIANISPGNWDEIKLEISLSNVVQRDTCIFAKNLEKNLDKYATDKESEVFSIIVSITITSFYHVKMKKEMIHKRSC